MAEFKLAYERTLGHEGGYVNDPDDRGGETYKGIARNYHANWEGWPVIDSLRDEVDFPECLSTNDSLQRMVREFYKANYWDKANLDSLQSQDVAEEIFDTGVNQGMGTAIKYLQEVLNMLNRNEQDYPDMQVDGVWGNTTETAYSVYMNTPRWTSRSVQKCVDTLRKLLNALQAEKYINIIRNDASQEKFMLGWLKRV